MINRVKSKESILVLMVIIIAYLLRILPYLLGYPIPVTEDGILDFGQVKYLLENKTLNLYDRQLGFGSFPILHLLVFFLAKTGLAPLTVFLFIPQLLASLGILFFYLFIKKYINTGQALATIFLIAVFVPHIHWTSQPVRETIGLFFFPLIIYCADRLKNQPSIGWWLVNLITIGLMVASHHWSTIMLIIWLVGFNLIFLKDRRQQIIYGLLTLITAGLALIYWHQFFPRGLSLLLEPLTIANWSWLAVIVIGGPLIILKRSKINLNRYKTKTIKTIFLATSLTTILIAAKLIAPLAYPLQTWLALGSLFGLTYIGFFYNHQPAINNFFRLAAGYLLPWLIIGPYLLLGEKLIAMPIDPFRTLEFIIFPLSIVAGQGLIILWRQSKLFFLLTAATLLFLATLTYPPIFVYQSTWQHTPFYDIRSDVRYLSAATIELIDWANQHGFNIESIVPEARAYQQVFYPPQKSKLTLIRNNDQIIDKLSYKIKDPIIKISPISAPPKENQKVIYYNQAGKLITKKYDAQFIDQKIPTSASVNQPAVAWIKMKNTGGETWQPTGEIKMIHLYEPTLIMELKTAVSSGQEGTFWFAGVIPNYPGDNVSRWQIFHPEIGFLGDISPLTTINITD